MRALLLLFLFVSVVRGESFTSPDLVETVERRIDKLEKEVREIQEALKPKSTVFDLGDGLFRYTCPICGKKFQFDTKKGRESCAVAHPWGQCCHFGEEEVKP